MTNEARFHINPDTGKPNICRATEKRGCKYKSTDGAEPPHYATKEEAQAHQNEKDEKAYGVVSTLHKDSGQYYHYSRNKEIAKFEKKRYPNEREAVKDLKKIIEIGIEDLPRESRHYNVSGIAKKILRTTEKGEIAFVEDLPKEVRYAATGNMRNSGKMAMREINQELNKNAVRGWNGEHAFNSSTRAPSLRR